ncbi:phage tail protein [Cereibacter sphaeroides]|uniref:phage tail protein n=1 Tax=Cereibacter sphaeroides TaxID=1063 RepID=UPI000F537C8C|nr:phage tail protein [Cereibacter sphaeroides]AZB63853.1 phage tail protein [Cereibacter sphaeroides]AZB68225.1 phage tail protein [Cereibacter sphaeroides]
MSRTMMRLGLFKFSLGTAAYQELERSAQYRWARQERIGTNDALQFTGLGPESVLLRGAIFPLFAGSGSEPTQLRLQASLGFPLPMIDGGGRVWGLWCVESVEEKRSVFLDTGAAKKIEFDLRLTRYDGGLRALLPF